MRKLMMFAGLATLFTTTVASAMGPRIDQYGFRQRGTTPRAAPWFLYWPYGAYWQTPAPTGFYGGYGPMTVGPAAGQIGAYNPQYPVYPGPTGYDY
jgi:hypothetical protein